MSQAIDPKQPRDRKASTTPKARPPAPPRANPPRPTVPDDPATPVAPVDPRSRWIGLAAIGCAALIAIVMTLGVFLPAIGVITSGRQGLRADPVAPLALILVCGREYAPADPAVSLTLEQVRSRDARDPIVVSAEADAGCPSGVCVDAGLCQPVVYTWTTDDRYRAYELVDSSP